MNQPLFPPNHQTRLLTTFKHVDEVLVQALSRLESASESPFAEYVADAGPAERKVLAEYLDPSFDVALRPRCYLCKLPHTDSVTELVPQHSTGSRTVVLVAPSKELLTAVRAAMTADGATAALECVDVRDSCPGGFPMWASGY